MKIGIIGAGISGITSAHCLKKAGHEVTVFEKSADIGGVWALGYPGVKLQNTGYHYRISDIPWPFEPDRHPTSGQIREYLQRAVELIGLDIRTEHAVSKIEENGSGWRVHYDKADGGGEAEFDFLLVAIGQYTEGKHKPEFPGYAEFEGEIITERDVDDLDVFNDKKVVVVGFGKSAVDMATFAVLRARQVHHVFRTPRWLIPFYICGIHYARLMFTRMTSTIMPCWDYPTRFESVLHGKLGFLIKGVWKFNTLLIRLHAAWYGIGKSKVARANLKSVLPQHYIVGDLRSAAAMAPEHYFHNVADEKIQTRHAEFSGFTEKGVKLGDGSVIECDQVVLSLGSESPTFPFFPDKYRKLLEAEHDGVQLYRHLLHPDIPRVAFAGFNHGFMHVPAVEVAMLWLSAYLRGDLVLPSVGEMRSSIGHILEWKREFINFEPSRSCAVNTRFQQYIDIMLKDLGLSPYRKLPNLFAELFCEYGAADYENIFREYEEKRKVLNLPIPIQALHT